MYLLNEFKEQTKSKELTTKQLRNRALINGALVVPGLAIAGNDIYKGANLEKNIKDKLAKNKSALVANHPDRFIGKDKSVIDEAAKKFKELSNEKDKLKQLQNSTEDLKNLKGLSKLKRAMGINIENSTKDKLEKLAEQQSKRLGRKVIIEPDVKEAIIKGMKLNKKISYGLTGLGVIGAGISAAKYINRKRKARADKGKIRGKYSK